MQSGITASQELQTAFNTLVSDPSQRALLAGIKHESLVPLATIPLSSSFDSDLDALQTRLSPTAAAYVLLKLAPGEPDGFAAVTFVPNAAPVRQKTLFASTRLTLVRELGLERFRETLFATEPADLSAAGWARHEAHAGLDAPLTAEEAALGGVRDAEARESQGTGARRGHVDHKIDVKVGEGVVEALSALAGEERVLVQLKYILPDETLRLDSTTRSAAPSALAGLISGSEPRYSFYSYPARTSDDGPAIVFIYTCPSSSKVKERMLYATGKRWTQIVAERDAGITVAKSIEASEPGDIGEETLAREFGDEGQKSEAKGFARPKRPGRR